jgi:hypothetical protein
MRTFSLVTSTLLIGVKGDKESVFIMFSNGYGTIQKVVLDLGIFDQTLFLRCSLNNPAKFQAAHR